MDYSSAFVCLMGMGTVFFGLICLIGLTMAMGAVLRRREAAPSAIPLAPTATPQGLDRQALAAAIAAAAAEELGADVTGIRILSIQKR